MGRKAGITKDEYLSLIKLQKKDFAYKEWVALTYAREWAFAKGERVTGQYHEEFARHYTKKEQSYIIKLLRIMLFANYCGNGYYKRPWKSNVSPEVCDINFIEKSNGELI